MEIKEEIIQPVEEEELEQATGGVAVVTDALEGKIQETTNAPSTSKPRIIL